MFFGSDLDPTVWLALVSQDMISWKNLIYGRMSGFWQDSQQTWLVRMQTRWKPSAATWTSRTMRGLWEISWEMWMQRNQIYHNPLHTWRLSVLDALDALDVKIHQEWASYDPLLYFPAGRRFFSGDLHFIISNYSAEAKRKWLASIRAARDHRHSHQVSESRAERAGMLAWLRA
jgi:hypothetical protein